MWRLCKKEETQICTYFCFPIEVNEKNPRNYNWHVQYSEAVPAPFTVGVLYYSRAPDAKAAIRASCDPGQLTF